MTKAVKAHEGGMWGMAKYLARGKVEHEFAVLDKKGIHVNFPEKLPITIGEFRIARSPNFEHYLRELGWIAAKQSNKPDWEYPMSYLYVETVFDIEDKGDPFDKADNILEQLEAMFRLYHTGGIYIRLHDVWHINEDKRERMVIFRVAPDRPEPPRIGLQGDYPLNDEVLIGFQTYFSKYWGIVSGRQKNLWSAIYRFNSSYERRTIEDRLVELMIAMEAIYSDKEYHRYKIPLRCSCLLFPPGEERKGNFKFIKDLYDDRSKLLHGGITDLPGVTTFEVNRFEDLVRRSIQKFMDIFKEGKPIPDGPQLDDILFFT